MSDFPAASKAIFGTTFAPIAVGDIVRLATGASFTVHGVRETADGMSLMTQAGAWLDGTDATLVAPIGE